MKYIINIDDTPYEGNGVKLWKASAYDTLVFDERGLDRLEYVYEHDGCDGCRFVHSDGYPCIQCSHNYMDKFKPQSKEIQVGDEVEYDGEFGIVVHRNGTYCNVLDRDLDRRTWGLRSCKRTGRTYPELIKALEQLPKE